jgi:hypothetical protein
MMVTWPVKLVTPILSSKSITGDLGCGEFSATWSISIFRFAHGLKAFTFLLFGQSLFETTPATRSILTVTFDPVISARAIGQPQRRGSHESDGYPQYCVRLADVKINDDKDVDSDV